jgi:hypothetical protein
LDADDDNNDPAVGRREDSPVDSNPATNVPVNRIICFNSLSNDIASEEQHYSSLDLSEQSGKGDGNNSPLRQES